MSNYPKIKNLIFSFFIIICIYLPVQGQSMQSMYFFDHVPQSNQLNPAFRPYFGLYIGTPGISSFQFNTNWQLSIADIFEYNAIIDSLIGPLHHLRDKDKFLKKFDERNSFYTDMQYNIISFGFKVKEWMFSFDINEKAFISFDYPSDLVKMGMYLLDTVADYQLKNLGINSSLYSEVGLSVSKKLGDQWVVGGRGKFLMGQANIYSNSSNIQIKTMLSEPGQSFVNQFNTDATINVYAPFADVEIKNDSIKDFGLKDDLSELIKVITSPSSTGFAIDLGATYNPIEELKLSASIVDLGFIKWKKDVYNFKVNGNFTFNGLPGIETDSLDNLMTDIMDSLSNSYKTSATQLEYTTNLAGKIFFAAEYFFHPKISAGLMSRTIVFRKTIKPEFTLAGTLRPLKGLSTTLSYSLLSNRMSSMGFGLSLRLGPMQTYFITDYLPVYYSADYLPYKLSQLNFRFGSNFIFKYRDAIKKTDKPNMYL